MIQMGLTEARRLEVLRGSGLLAAGPISELDELCWRAQDYFRVRLALVTLIDADRQVLLAAAGTDLRETPRSWAFCDHTILEDEVLVVPDATLDPRFAQNPLVTGEPHLRFYAGAPVTYVDGARLGSFCLLDTEPREISLIEQNDLALTAEKVAGLLIEREYDLKFRGEVA